MLSKMACAAGTCSGAGLCFANARLPLARPAKSPAPGKTHPKNAHSALLRAQISVEALLAFLIFLSLLAVSYAAASRIGAAAFEKVQKEIFMREASEFASKAESVCRLGAGNLRISNFSAKTGLSLEGSALRIRRERHSALLTFDCAIIAVPEEGKNSFMIENFGGEISFG